MKSKKGKFIKYIITILSVGIFAYSYFVIHTEFTNKTIDTYKEIESIKLQIQERGKMLEEEKEILASLEDINKQKQDIIGSYPVHIAKEDNFIFLDKLQKHVKIDISSMNISNNTNFYNTILPAVSSGPDIEDDFENHGQDESSIDKSTMNGLVNTISMNFKIDYENFKLLSEYIRNHPEQTVIDSVAINFDNSTGDLEGNLVLKRFILSGTDKGYKRPVIDGIRIGTDNIFGTGSRLD